MLSCTVSYNIPTRALWWLVVPTKSKTGTSKYCIHENLTTIIMSQYTEPHYIVVLQLYILLRSSTYHISYTSMNISRYHLWNSIPIFQSLNKTHQNHSKPILSQSLPPPHFQQVLCLQLHPPHHHKRALRHLRTLVLFHLHLCSRHPTLPIHEEAHLKLLQLIGSHSS